MKTKTAILAATAMIMAFTVSAPAFSAGKQKSPEKRWSRMIKRADLNGDQKISRQELQNQIARTIAALDRNRDGGISLAEISAQKDVIKAENRKIKAMRVSGSTSQRLMRMPKRVAKHFSKIDADGNGVLSRAELGRVADRLFNRRDRNKDGYLSMADMKV